MNGCLLALFFRSYMRQLGLDRLVDVRHQGRVQAEEVGEQAAAVGGAEVGGLEEALSGCLGVGSGPVSDQWVLAGSVFWLSTYKHLCIYTHTYLCVYIYTCNSSARNGPVASSS